MTQIALTDKQSNTLNVLEHFVFHAYDHAAKKFREVPTAGNFTELSGAMLVRQAWSQRHSPSNTHTYCEWLDFMAEAKVENIPQLIWQRAFGGKYGILQEVLAKMVDPF